MGREGRCTLGRIVAIIHLIAGWLQGGEATERRNMRRNSGMYALWHPDPHLLVSLV